MPPAAQPRAFLPTTARDLEARGWDQLDILIVSGDAYVDHPAFGPPLIARWLEHSGFRVGIVAQPRWDTPDDIARMGTPRLFVGVSAGNLDSMLNKLTGQKKVRGSDPYSPGGRVNARPNRASIVYSNLCRAAFPGVPIVLGGIEASLRRIAHYDYWSDAVRRSILLDAKAHLLAFGMAETAILEIAQRLRAGQSVTSLTDIRGTAYALSSRAKWEALGANPNARASDPSPVLLPSFEQARDSAAAFADMTRKVELESNPHNARALVQPHGDEAVVLNPPALPLDPKQLDALYALPFVRDQHPSYRERVPALASVRRSLAVTRGCFGGCAFCSIAAHEGKIVQSRSKQSVIREARTLASDRSFDGTIADVGGPTANTYGLRCKSEAIQRACRRPSCLHPRLCRNLLTDHGPYMDLLSSLRQERGVRHVFVNSGVRYDLAVRQPAFIRMLAEHHTSGQLSVAPEHVRPQVLMRMRKPDIATYERFAKLFGAASDRAGKKQFLVPYLIVGHPGATLDDAIALGLYLRKRNLRPRQIQEFIPTPMSVATAMYHTGLDPMTGERITVVRDLRTKRAMKALLLWWDKDQWPLAREALRRANRKDLIGKSEGALVPPGRALR